MSAGEPVWILPAVVRAIHSRQIAEHDGEAGLRDEGLLASALARPRNRFSYETETADAFDFAAEYAWGICRNHPFVDGNKRTALVVGLTFLSLQGIELRADRVELYRVFVELAEGTRTVAALAEWLREHTDS